MNRFVALLVSAVVASGATVTVDSATKYQTMTGWEVTVIPFVGHPDLWGYPSRMAPETKDTYIQTMIDSGINRARLEVFSGMEQTVDYFSIYLNDHTNTTKLDQYRCWSYAPVNDNSDSDNVNPAGFQWTFLDKQITETIIPMRAKLAARGESLYVNLTYVDFNASTRVSPRCEPWIGKYPPHPHTKASEYGEFILAVFQHMDSTYGFVPDAVEVILEPDGISGGGATPAPYPWTAGSGGRVGDSLVAAKKKLDAGGYGGVDFIAPSIQGLNNYVFWDNTIAVKGAEAAITEFSYHLYYMPTDANLREVGKRAAGSGKKTSMLEFWWSDNDYRRLHKDLTYNGAQGISAWQQSVFNGSTADDRTPVYVHPNNPTFVGIPTAERYYRHYKRHVRMGAQRIGATDDSDTLETVAFVNPNGAHTVVLYTTGPLAPIHVSGLPAGAYKIRYSTASVVDADPGDQVISAGQQISASMPAAGVMEIYQDLPPASGSERRRRTGRTR